MRNETSTARMMQVQIVGFDEDEFSMAGYLLHYTGRTWNRYSYSIHSHRPKYLNAAETDTP
jgi:hypothetical protein